MADKNFITEVDICDEAKSNFLTFATEVLTDRAIPDASDGLLSSQRKILWTMEDHLKMNSKSKTKKCNAIVGSTLATSYFHGDAACYDVLRRLSLNYQMRYPLIIGQGQLGTQENNDMFAHSRYTEAKPSIFADLMMEDFKKNVVPLKRTYNDEYDEPVVVPALFPNAICNGRQAIGVSMSHNSASANLTEVCNAIIAYIEKGSPLTIDELLSYMPGPDFPLGNVVINAKDVREAYATGKSKVSLKIRGDYEIKDNKIIFNTIPYRTYRNKIKSQIEENLDELDKYFSDFNDKSNLGQNKLIFTVKSGVDPTAAVNKLFALTDLQTTLSYNMNYIVNGTPKLCSMMDLIKAYVNHQEQVLINATTYDKEKADARIHILKGLIAAVDAIDQVIELIKGSSDKNEAITKLINFLSIDEIQAKAILDMKLGKLTKIDKDELVCELKELEVFVANCIKLLNEKECRNIALIEKITNLRNKYGDERRTQLLNIEVPKEKKEKPAVIPEDCAVIVTQSGLVKRIPSKSFKTTNRNTVGVKNGDDIIQYSLKTNTVDTLLIFSDAGKMYRVYVGNIPEGTQSSRGASIRELTKMADDERPLVYTSFNDENMPKYVMFATVNGIVKKVPTEEFNSKRTGIQTIKLKEGDKLATVNMANDGDDMLLITKNGMAIRFESAAMPVSSRTAQGVKGIALADGDYVIDFHVIKDNNDYLMVAAENCLGKRIALSEFTSQNRGGKGVIYSKTPVAGAVIVKDTSNVLVIGNRTSVSIKASDISATSRTAAGVSLIKNNETIKGVYNI